MSETPPAFVPFVSGDEKNWCRVFAAAVRHRAQNALTSVSACDTALPAALTNTAVEHLRPECAASVTESPKAVPQCLVLEFAIDMSASGLLDLVGRRTEHHREA